LVQEARSASIGADWPALRQRRTSVKNTHIEKRWRFAECAARARCALRRVLLDERQGHVQEGAQPASKDHRKIAAKVVAPFGGLPRLSDESGGTGGLI